MWLKIQDVHAYNFGASGSNVMKLFNATCHEAGMLTWAQLLGKACKFGSSKFGAISDNFRL